MNRLGHVPIRLLAETLAIVVLGEGLVALLLGWATPALHGLAAGLANACALATLTAPLLYWRGMQAVRQSAQLRAASATAAPAEATPPTAAQHRRRRAIVLTAVAQFSGLLLTAGAVAYVSARSDDEGRQLFERHAERLEGEVLRRFQQPVYGLKGVRGAHAAAGRLSLDAFRAHVQSRDLATEFPGVSGFGLIERVPRERLAAYIAAERAAGVPDFEVSSRGTAADLYVVKYVEPLSENFVARGFDAGSEAVRREALERAVARAEPALTGRITLVGGDTGRPGFLYLLPVFRPGSDPVTPAQRLQALVGLVYAPISASALLTGAARAADGMLDFELFDGAGAQPSDRVFDSTAPLPPRRAGPAAAGTTGAAASAADAAAAPPPAIDRRHLYSGLRTLSVGGRTLTLRTVTSAAFEARRDRGPLLPVALGGTLLSLLLALAVWSLAAGRVRAQTLADRMTADLDRLAQVVRHTQNAVLITDREHRITWINEGFTRLTGHDLDSARGRTPGELLGSGKADPAVLRKLAAAVADGRPCRVEILNRTRDGRDYWIDTELQPLHGPDGTLVGHMEIGTDITDRRHADDQLAAATRALTRERQRLDDILRGTDAGTWEWNPQTGQILVNERWAGMLGHTLAELAPMSGDTFWHLLLPEDREPTRALLQRHLDGEAEYYEAELRMRHRDGGVVWVLTRGRVSARSADGRPEWVAGTHQDITDRKRSEAQARDSEHLMRVVTDNMPARIAYWDAERRLRFANKGFFDQFGGTLASQLGRSSAQVLGAARAEAGEPLVQQVLQGRAQHVEREQRGADGEARHELTHMIPDTREGAGGAVSGYFVLTMDVSVIKRAEEALRRSNAELTAARDRAEQSSVAKSQFLANMSHEIRTPMNAILGMLKLLQRTPLSPPQRDYADKTEHAAQALLGLLNDILDFSKIEAGKMSLDPRPFRLERLLRDLSVILAANLGSKPVALGFDIDPAVPRALLGDDLRLQQVLINLAGNAIKFTPAGEVVLRLTLQQQGSSHCRIGFEVRDSGIGIAPEMQAHIFSGFSQAEASTTRRFGGTGLGLSISQRLVGLMGGRITLHSVPGQGSCFGFELDFRRADGPAQPWLPAHDALHPLSAAQLQQAAWQALGGEHEPPLPAAGLPQRLAGLRLLVVEDNANNRQVARELLEGEGAEVVLADDGEQGVAALAARGDGGAPGFDLVLMDLQMPRMDGFTAATLMRERFGPAQLPIVAITANAMPSDRDACLAAGMNDHVGKPFDLDELVAVLRRHAQAARQVSREALAADSLGAMPLPEAPPEAPPETRPPETRRPEAPLPEALLAEASRLGIDLAGALGRLGGRSGLWLRTAQGFAAELPQRLRDCEALLAQDDRRSAARELHTLKGLAATLGAQGLADAAARAEATLPAAAAPAGLEPALRQAIRQAAAAFDALIEQVHGLQPAAVAGDRPAPDAGALRQGLLPLAALLRDTDMAATDAFAALMVQHEAGFGEALQPLSAAMAALDFEAALQACERLAAGLDA